MKRSKIALARSRRIRRMAHWLEKHYPPRRRIMIELIDSSSVYEGSDMPTACYWWNKKGRDRAIRIAVGRGAGYGAPIEVVLAHEWAHHLQWLNQIPSRKKPPIDFLPLIHRKTGRHKRLRAPRHEIWAMIFAMQAFMEYPEGRRYKPVEIYHATTYGGAW